MFLDTTILQNKDSLIKSLAAATEKIKLCSTNRYIITWLLHQIFMYFEIVMLAAG